jgi:hypothetical protein
LPNLKKNKITNILTIHQPDKIINNSANEIVEKKEIQISNKEILTMKEHYEMLLKKFEMQNELINSLMISQNKELVVENKSADPQLLKPIKIQEEKSLISQVQKCLNEVENFNIR